MPKHLSSHENGSIENGSSRGDFTTAWSFLGEQIRQEHLADMNGLAALMNSIAERLKVATSAEEKARENGELDSARKKREKAHELANSWESIGWEHAQRSYRDRLHAHVCTTRLLGHSKPVRIDKLFTDVFVFEQRSALRRSDLKLENPDVDPYTFQVPYERRNALDLVSSGGHVYVLGHPGAGKTTFLKYLAILACEKKISRTPIYIPLRDVVQRKANLRSFIENEFDICELPDAQRFCGKLLSETETLVLIDGLDEVQNSGEHRRDLVYEITELARRYPKAQLVLTCRIAASDHAFEQFTYCEVAQFTIEQQRSFIAKWYETETDWRSTLLSSWDSPRMAPLRDLAKTPLLLAMICLAFDEAGEIPERRTDLYRDAIETLLRRWDSSRSIKRDPFYAGLSSARREQLLQELAFNFHKENRILFSPEVAAPVINRWFGKLPDPPPHDAAATEELLDQVEAQHGLVVQRAAGIYSFSHLSLQEFFTARSIAHGNPFETVERTVSMYFSEPRWREVFLFLAGLLPDGSAMLEQFRKSASKFGTNSKDVRRFNEFISIRFRERESEWRAGGYKEEDDTKQFYGGIEPARIALNSLRHSVQDLKWLPPNSGLLLKIDIADKLLFNSEPDPNGAFVGLESSAELTSYLHAAELAVDCAAVAVCDNRERAISWILSPQFS